MWRHWRRWGPLSSFGRTPSAAFALDLLTRTLRALGSPINPHRMVNAALSRGMEDVIADPRLLDAAVPAMNGHFDAVSLGAMYAMLAGGGQLGGVRVLSEETVRKASEIQNDQPRPGRHDDYAVAAWLPSGPDYSPS